MDTTAITTSLDLRRRYGVIVPASSVQALLALPRCETGARFMFPFVDAEGQMIGTSWLVAADIIRGELPLPEVGDQEQAGVHDSEAAFIRWMNGQPRIPVPADAFDAIKHQIRSQTAAAPQPTTTEETHHEN